MNNQHPATPYLLAAIALLVVIWLTIVVASFAAPAAPEAQPPVAQEQSASITARTSCTGLFAINCGNITASTAQEQQAQPAAATQPAETADMSREEMVIACLAIVLALFALLAFAARGPF